MSVRNLGSNSIEIFNKLGPVQRMISFRKDSTVHRLAVELQNSNKCGKQFIATGSMFGPPDVFQVDWHPLVLSRPIDGCGVVSNPDLYRGKIVVVNRGNCSFFQKANFLQSSGAVAAIVINTFEPLHIFSMAYDYTGENVHIPTVMVQGSQGRRLRSCFLESLQKRETPPSARITYRKHDTSHSDFIQGRFDDFTLTGVGQWKVRIHKEGLVHHLTVL